MPSIDGDRVIGDLKRLAEFGRYKSGVHRPTYSAEDMAARHWLAEQFAVAGLDSVIDGIGNVIGRNRRAGPLLLVGSHSESQPHGGWLDGALGVVYGLELVRIGLAVDAVAWADEEGHYGNMLGSRSFTDGLAAAEIDGARSRDGVPLRQALAAAGLAARGCERVDPGRYVGYLEAHIEQGDTLDRGGLRIGIVDAIIGNWNYRVTLTGEQNHAGTTQMSRRRDAGVAMVRLAAHIHDRFAEIAGPRSVWTIGRMLLDPNAPSIVPGRAEMQVQFRDTDTAILARFEQELLALVAAADRAGPCRAAITPLSRSEPAAMDERFQEMIAAAAERHAPGRYLRMPSGAGHDAQVLSRRLRSAMMFVPSLGGISHHWAEDTKEEDIVLGAQVFADSAALILAAA
ncbi:MAG: hydantoinase/carbamoylase family amidase [Thiohalocapsa sp.]